MAREVVVNGRFLSRRVTGVERHGREILRHIGGRVRLEKSRMNGTLGHAWEQLVLPTTLGRESILWSPANTGPVLVRDQAVSLHDLSPLDSPRWYRRNFVVWYRLCLPILIKRARVIFTPSEYVRGKVMKRFGIENVIVTPNGVDTAHFHPGARQCTYELPERFVLFVGSLQPRKNLRGLLKAWREINDDFPDVWLVVAGAAGRVFAKDEIHADERVRFLGYVPEHMLPSLYATATLFVLPSFDEGFGLPALEAMACGTPVIVSDGGALPETVGEAGLIFKLSDPEGLSSRVRECLMNKDLCASLIENGFERIHDFSWQKPAEIVWNTLNEL